MTMFFSGLLFGVGVTILIDYLIEQNKKQTLLEEELRVIHSALIGNTKKNPVKDEELDDEELDWETKVKLVNEMLSELPTEYYEGITDLSYENVRYLYNEYYG